MKMLEKLLDCIPYLSSFIMSLDHEIANTPSTYGEEQSQSVRACIYKRKWTIRPPLYNPLPPHRLL